MKILLALVGTFLDAQVVSGVIFAQINVKDPFMCGLIFATGTTMIVAAVIL